MTTPTRILKKDEVHVVIDAERSVLREIYDHFSFQIPNAKFDPRVKNKIWDGFIRILNLKTREFYVGLVPELCKFLKKNGYEYVLDSDIIVGDYFTPIDFERITEALETVYEARDYQQNAVSRCINEGRALVLASTGSGKSFIQYLVSSYYRAKGLRTLLIVPTQSLVEQMYKDFESYSPYKPLMQKIMSGYEKELSAHYTFTLENGNTCTYEGNERIKVLESGEKKIEKSAKMITRKDRIAYADVNDGYAKILKIEELSSEITIATWQSIHRLDQSWFDLYNVVMCDECLDGETLINTDEGPKKIKDIVEGDIVETLNETTLIFEYKKVIKKHNSIPRSNEVYEITTDTDKTLKISGNHKLYTKRGWIRADELLHDDELLDSCNIENSDNI
jgi:hypothetical protein